MKLKPIFFFLTLLAAVSCTNVDNDKIRVAVFQGDGGSATCIRETVAALTVDNEMEVSIVTSTDISNGALSGLDAIIIPGGGGSRQYLNLGQKNMDRIREFVRNGGGAVGICAGAYLFSDTPDYSCMAMTGARAIDREHDNRGHGMAKFTLNDAGKEVFPELAARDTNYVFYYEGPVFVDNENSAIEEYTVFGIMESDVHEEGNAPANMTNGKPFFIGNEYGEGKVFCTIAHPEATPGKIWIIPRMVRWTLDLPLISYTQEAVTPPVEPSEILMSIQDLEYESSLLQTFLYGTPEEKTDALDWLEAHYSWSAKTWLQGLLYDASPVVRKRAAEYIGNIHYLPFIADLKSALDNETDAETRTAMQTVLGDMEKLYNR